MTTLSKKQRKMRNRILIAAALLVLVKLLPLTGWVRGLCCLAPYFIIGYDVLRKAALGIVNGQVFDENFLMALATVGAYATGEFDEAVFVMLFYQTGELFQDYAVGKSRTSIAALMDIRPDTANLETENGLETVDPEDVAVGSVIVVKPGERVPLDGTVLEGSSTLDTAALTGEALPRSIRVGDDIISGCVNLTGLLRVTVTKPCEESTVSKILELVENSSEKKAVSEQFITRFAKYYTPCVVYAALALFLIPTVLLAMLPTLPGFLAGTVWTDWLHRALTFLVISCPCALVISVPLSFFGGIGGASKCGILVKGGNYLEALAKADTVVFDKTGTLTKGTFAVSAVHPEVGFEADQVLEYAALAEQYSTHPIAVSLREACKSGMDRSRVSNVEEIAGHGIMAEVDGKRVGVGNSRLMERQSVNWLPCELPGTIVHVTIDGFYAGHIVIADQPKPDAKEAIAFLKRRDAGRATFLPMSAIRGDMLREPRLAQEYGFVGIASQLVTYDARYDGIFQNLLGRTVVVEDLDCGVNMARRYQNRFRIVTLDGQVINRGGSMTGGSVSRSAGVLSRANELQRLAGQLEQLRGQLADADRRAQETGRELQKAQYELDVAKEQQRAAAQQVLTLEGRQEHHEILLENLRLSQDGLQQERETLTRRLQEQETQMQAVRQEIAAHEGEAERLSRQAEESRAGQSDLQTRTDEISGQITEHKTALAALAAERETSLHSRRELERLQVQMHTDRAGREALLERFRRSNEEAGREMNIHRQKAEELRTQCRQLKEQLASLAAEKLELERRRTQQNQEMQRCNEEVLHTEREVARLEQQKNAAAMEEKNILDKLWERYELSHSEAQSQRMELESIPKATRRIGELNREIKSLGTPNIGAIEEFDRVNTRYTYLSEQRTDVEKAKEELTGVIDEITRQMTEIFAQQFRLLNESFQETFLELFGGGKARLELEDENDILGCGIEIKVQPPGKQLKTITLLSGGEKAFVAIALYFAIMKVHPTPFCVMDEIEAALDEANVVRYARYMRRIAGKTQFIVITHRRGTMEEADVLYGVTMQERGVSRILTINLNDMAKELKIK